MLSIMLLVCVTTITLAAPENTEILTDLYHNVAEQQYIEGIDTIKSMIEENEICAVANTIDSLLSAKPDNALTFAYKLWLSDKKDIVQIFFPKEFGLLFNKDTVRIVNQKYNLPLKLDGNVDHDKDRALWGNAISVNDGRLKWKFEPIWDQERVLFKIKNLERNMYLKLNYKADKIGDRAVWGNNLNISESRLTWSMVPIWDNKKLYFHIINEEFGLGLKLAMTTDDINDRRAYGHAGSYTEDPERFRWKISQ